MEYRGGFVLSLVLTVLLALTILFTCLLRVPGGVFRYTGRYAREVQAVYDAESAVIANLYGFEDSFFAGLPAVSAFSDGLWGHACASLSPDGDARAVPGAHLCASYGRPYARMRFDDWFSGMNAYRSALRDRIVAARGFRVASGNRRIFSLDSSVALHVSDGDLTLDLDSRVTSGSFLVDGTVSLKGRTHFDTLRIFAQGEVTLGGDASVSHLEVYSGASVEARSSFRFAGLLYARDEVRLGGHVRAHFPSVAVAMGSGNSRATLVGHASFEGVLASPGGLVEVDVRDSLAGAAFPGEVRDSSLAILPVFFEGSPAVFERRAVP